MNKKQYIKIITEVIILLWIGFFFGSWLFQLFMNSYFGNIKNIDFIVIPDVKSWKDYEVVEKPILLTQSGSAIYLNNGYNESIMNTWIESDTGTTSTWYSADSNSNIVDLSKYYALKLENLKQIDNKYNGWIFIDKLNNKWVNQLWIEQISFTNWRIVPVVQSIGSDLPMEKVWRTYFNSNTVYLDKAKQMKAFVMFAHSNYWEGWVEIGEQLIKMNKGDTLQVWDTNVKITNIMIQKDNSLRFDKVLEYYWNNQQDIIFYTCIKIDWKILWKIFFIAKKV